MGQATIEYVIVIGFAAIIGITFLTTFSNIVNNAILGFNAVLERELVPVGFPECGTTSGKSTWEN